MNRDALKAQLVRHEGLRLSCYQDSRGYLTIGVGRLIDPRKGGGITHEEAMVLLDHDIDRTVAELRRDLPLFDAIDATRQQVLVNMSFNLGVAGLLRFQQMLAALARGDNDGAAAEMLDSTWARQVGARAQELAEMMRTGTGTVPL